MLTWLDFYVQGAAEKVAGIGGFKFSDDVSAMAFLSAARLRSVVSSAHRGSSGIDTDEASEATFMSCVHAITTAASKSRDQIDAVLRVFGNKTFTDRLYQVKAVRPSPDLVATLRGAKAPETDAWRQALRSATWYFDFPHRALLIGDRLQIRAAFTQPTEWGDIAAVCILSVPGSNRFASRFAWLFGQHPVYGLQVDGVDKEQVRENVENFLRLLVLYEQTAARAEYVPIPRVDPKKAREIKPKKLKAKLKKASMFTIRDLRPPEDRFGRRLAGSSGSGWHLERPVEVRGHFKWQPYGKKMAKRKLIWIDTYVRGPKNLAVKPIIEIVGRTRA